MVSSSASPQAPDARAPTKRILLTSHCVLNQNAVVQPLARSAGVMRSAAAWATDQGYGIYQLPCPEFRFAGPTRAPATVDDYDTPEFHASNRELLVPVIRQLVRFVEAGYEIVGGLHVAGSPACDPATGNWIADLLDAAAEAGIEIRQLWQIPQTASGDFDPADPDTSVGHPTVRRALRPDPGGARQSAHTLLCGPRIPTRSTGNHA